MVDVFSLGGLAAEDYPQQLMQKENETLQKLKTFCSQN